MAQRAFDVFVASALLILTLPAWPVIAIAVKLSSPGPVFYRGKRLGLNAVNFEILKFRSMREASSAATPGITVAGDTRVTSVGRALRAIKADELPQLLNVLRGDMSIVGPRPEDPRYLDFYPREMRAIFRFRPGITSPASIAFRREEELLAASGITEKRYGEEILPTKVAMDLEYCRSRTVVRDIGIVAKTVLSIVRR